MSLELQDRLERLDPKHASVWKRVFAAPAVCLFDVHSRIEEEEKSGQAVYYWRRRKVVTHFQHSPSVHNINVHNRDNTGVGDSGGTPRLITAVYLPVESSLRCVDLVLGRHVVATWTPDQPERGISLETILLQSRRIPKEERRYGGYPYDYRPSPEMRIGDQIYRRVVLLYPGIDHYWNAYFSFTLDKCESFEYYQEELALSAPNVLFWTLLPTPNAFFQDGGPDAFRCFSPFPAAKMPESMRALLARSEIPKQLLASLKWAVPALSTASPCLS